MIVLADRYIPGSAAYNVRRVWMNRPQIFKRMVGVDSREANVPTSR